MDVCIIVDLGRGPVFVVALFCLCVFYLVFISFLLFCYLKKHILYFVCFVCLLLLFVLFLLLFFFYTGYTRICARDRST